MALTVELLKAHCNVTTEADDALLTLYLSAATAYVEGHLGFPIDDDDEFPDGTPADLELAVLQLAADRYENREASHVGVSAQAIPFGVLEAVSRYRNYTFGLADD